MTTLLIPLLAVSVLAVFGYSLLGGSVLVWFLVSWFALVPAVLLYVSVSSKADLTAVRSARNR